MIKAKQKTSLREIPKQMILMYRNRNEVPCSVSLRQFLQWTITDNQQQEGLKHGKKEAH